MDGLLYGLLLGLASAWSTGAPLNLSDVVLDPQGSVRIGVALPSQDSYQATLPMKLVATSGIN